MKKQTAEIGEGRSGPGRPKGKPNRTTTALKDAILAAAAEHGEDDNGTGGLTGYLRKVAREDVKAFSGLLGRVLPLQIAGDPTAPLTIMVVSGVPRTDD